MEHVHTSTDIEYREIPTWMFALFMGFQFVLLVIGIGTGLYNTYFR